MGAIIFSEDVKILGEDACNRVSAKYFDGYKNAC